MSDAVKDKAEVELKELRDTIEAGITEKFEAQNEKYKAQDELMKSYDEKIANLGAEQKEKVEKITESLNATMEENQKKYAEAQSVEEMKANSLSLQEKITERLENLEKTHVYNGDGKNPEDLGSEVKSAFAEFICKKADFSLISQESKDVLLPKERKSMGTDIGATGGHLVVDPLSDFWMAEARKVSQILPFATTFRRASETIAVPVVRNDLEVSSLGQREVVPNTQIKSNKKTITAHRVTKNVCVTQSLLSLSNSPIDIVSYVTENSTAQIVEEIDRQSVVGDGGSNEMFGITLDPNVTAVDTAGSLVTTLTDVMLLEKNLFGIDRRNAVFGMNISTAITLRTEQSAAGGYLWVSGAEGRPDTLNGRPVMIFDHMADGNGAGNAGNVGVFMGNIKKYGVLDALEMRVKVDDNTLADQDMVRYIWTRYIGGDILDEKAFVYLTVKA